MKISLEWLGDFLPGPRDMTAARELADALTNGGLPTEHFEPHGDDIVIDVEVTSNRGDCLSHMGVARELAALLDREASFSEPGIREVAQAAATATSVRIEAPELCPHYTARVLRGVRVGASPPWMVRRLEAVGVRSINNLVDITNYVMFEMGQPLHAFDFDRLRGRQIIVRRAAAGEKIVSIDGKERALAAGMLVIADAERAVALAGIMGGLDSEVSNATVNVLLESARFDSLTVRKAARALAMKSESSYRFERGLDPTLPARASRRAAELMLELGGGELLSGVVEAGAPGYAPRTLSLRLGKLRQVMGFDIPAGQAVDALRRLQFTPRLGDDANGGQIDVTIPSWRLDVNVEVDLVEEVARVVGYDKIPVRDEISIRLTPSDPAARAIDRIRANLVAAGYFESITFSFVSDLLAGDFLPPEAVSLPRAEPGTRKADARLRPSILPGLLESVLRNEHAGTPAARLFEIGSVFHVDAAGKIVEQRKLGLVGGEDLRDVRGAVETLLHALDAAAAVNVIPDARRGYAVGACGRIEWGGRIVGYLGKTDRAITEKLSLRSLPAAAELLMEPLLAGAQPVPQLRELPRYPAVRRDLSTVLPEATRYQALDALIRGVKPANLEDVEYVTTYRGKPLEKGQKSVTVTLVFRSPSVTLTGEAVEEAVKGIVGAIRETLGGTLRE